MVSGDPHGEWKTLGEEPVVGTPWFCVGLADVELPDGRRIDHYLFRLPPVVLTAMLSPKQRERQPLLSIDLVMVLLRTLRVDGSLADRPSAPAISLQNAISAGNETSVSGERMPRSIVWFAQTVPVEITNGVPGHNDARRDQDVVAHTLCDHVDNRVRSDAPGNRVFPVPLRRELGGP